MGEIPESGVAKAEATPPEPPSWLSLRVFYLRVSRCEVNDSTLTVTHVPLTPDTVLEPEASGAQPGVVSVSSGGHVSCALHRDRADDVGEGGCTFVGTAAVRMAGSVRFEVHGRGERLLVGILETCEVGGGVARVDNEEEAAATRRRKKSWVMKCQVAPQRSGAAGLLKRGGGKEAKPLVVEVYVAGLSRGAPVVLTKAMQLRFRASRRRRRQVEPFLEPIPECGEHAEEPHTAAQTPRKHETEVSEYYRCYKPDVAGDGGDDGVSCVMSAAAEGEEEYGELSWFTAGVRVGVGISIGICLGVGIGAGLLARSYQSTTRGLRRRMISNLLF